ncbi:MAG: GNAT family N-acetyltransferase [Cocleimonas sp.]
MQIHIHAQISQINAEQWNSLVTDNNPFMRHEFLAALETHKCASPEFGWHPSHIGIYEGEDGDEKEQSKLIAAMPLYAKTNSYGEFVFDHAWSDAYHRNQLEYFPKLVSSIPYTPASGQRLLCEENRRDELYPILLETVQQFCQEQKYSSFHCLFANSDEQEWLEGNGLMTRHDCQFHWHNQDYTCFEDFLDKLDKKKRKNVRQERRRVKQQAVNIRVLDGHTASEKDWHDFARFYQMTFMEKHGTATLNEGFFKEVGDKLPDQVVLVLADKVTTDDSVDICIAGSLMYRSDTTLYGRHWGCIEQIDKLHFEACYYQGIEYCIANGLQHFEPGAQGQHKIARGFVPTLTRSSHWLNNSPFQESVDNFINYERNNIEEYMKSLKSPYKDDQLIEDSEVKG